MLRITFLVNGEMVGVVVVVGGSGGKSGWVERTHEQLVLNIRQKKKTNCLSDSKTKQKKNCMNIERIVGVLFLLK